MNKYYRAAHIFIEDKKNSEFELPSNAVILYSEVTEEKGKVGLKVWYGTPYITDEQLAAAMKAAGLEYPIPIGDSASNKGKLK